MAAANHGERIGGRKINGAGTFGDGLLAGVDQVRIDFGIEWIGAHAEHAVFGLQDDVHAGWDKIGHQRGHTDAEIDVIAVSQFAGNAAGDAFTFLVVSERHRLSLRSTVYSSWLSCGASFNTLGVVRALKNRVDENAGGMNLIRGKIARLDELFDFGDDVIGGSGHHRIKVAGGFAVDEIAHAIALRGFDESKVAAEGAFQDVMAALELARFLSFGDQRSVTGGRVESRNAGAGGAEALGQSALRVEFHLQF